MKENQERAAIIVMGIIQLVGLVGLNYADTRIHFEALVSVNLLFIFAIVFSLHPKWNQKYLFYLLVTFLAGMLVEIVGVNYGQPFGTYRYTSALGTSIKGVPVIIGMNWVLLIYCAGMVSRKVDPSKTVQVLAGGALMLLMDVLIEPFAIRHGLWVWEAGNPPLQNYLAWFGISCLLMLVFQRSFKKTTNETAARVFLLLLAFFLIDWLVALI